MRVLVKGLVLRNIITNGYSIRQNEEINGHPLSGSVVNGSLGNKDHTNFIDDEISALAKEQCAQTNQRQK